MLVSFKFRATVKHKIIIAKIGKSKDRSKLRFQNDMSADYGQESKLLSMKHNASFDYDQRELPNLNLNNSMLSKPYGENDQIGNFWIFTVF